jgi:hypothetical protein
MFTRYNVVGKKGSHLKLQERLGVMEKPRELKTREINIPNHAYSKVALGDVLALPTELDTGSEAWSTADIQHSPNAMTRQFPLLRRGV